MITPCFTYLFVLGVALLLVLGLALVFVARGAFLVLLTIIADWLRTALCLAFWGSSVLALGQGQ